MPRPSALIRGAAQPERDAAPIATRALFITPLSDPLRSPFDNSKQPYGGYQSTMKHLAVPLLLSFVALPAELVGAIRFDLQGRRGPSARHLHKRGTIAGSTSLDDANNIAYTLNLTLGGSQFEVQIDTGSSDLYVAGNVPGSKNTGKTTSVTYAIGEAEGPIKTATMDFLGFTVENQAFLDLTANSQNQTAGSGLIGLGPHTGSQIQEVLGNGSGDPPLDRIFQLDKSTPNYITVLLGRADDPKDPIQGNLTIGEVLPGYSNLTSQPQLNVTVLPNTEAVGQHWQTLLDADGIIGPNGKVVDVTTGVASTSNDKQLTVVFDTGYTLAQVPSAVAQAFYESVPGAKLVNVDTLGGPTWEIPCDYEINITLKFGGVSFPVNPLDASMNLSAAGVSGSTCYGGFQPNENAKSPLYDMIFGMAFLRNVYMLINFGDFVDNTTNTRADPYIQLLSVSNNSAQIHSDFVSLRGAKSWNPGSAINTAEGWARSHLRIVIGVSIALGVLVITGIIIACTRFRRRRLSRTPAGFMNMQSSYQPLSEPAPQEAHDLHLMGTSQQQYAGGGYANPWDSRY